LHTSQVFDQAFSIPDEFNNFSKFETQGTFWHYGRAKNEGYGMVAEPHTNPKSQLWGLKIIHGV
jgi:hypothetical protein